MEALGGQERPGQIQMAEAVARAMTSGEHLLVQAGTGTGKSLGYLVPALLHDRRVVVATATLALQHQLVERDIPALLEAADHVLHEQAVVRRAQGPLELRLPAPDPRGRARRPGRAGRDARPARWAARCWRCGRGPRSRRRPRAPATATRRPSTPTGCGGRSRSTTASASAPPSARSRDECFAERAKEKAAQSQLIVTNHSLLAIDAIEGVPMIPEYDVVVIDEAHELSARVTQAATDELSVPEVERAARRAQRHVEGTEADDLADAGDALRAAFDECAPGRIDTLPESLSRRAASWSATPPAR